MPAQAHAYFPEQPLAQQVPYGYGSYCIDDRGATPTVLMGTDMVPGVSIGTAQCQRVLAP
jgi:hypothetical protein